MYLSFLSFLIIQTKRNRWTARWNERLLFLLFHSVILAENISSVGRNHAARTNEEINKFTRRSFFARSRSFVRSAIISILRHSLDFSYCTNSLIYKCLLFQFSCEQSVCLLCHQSRSQHPSAARPTPPLRTPTDTMLTFSPSNRFRL